MDYADAVAVFFASREEGTPLPAAVAEGSPARRRVGSSAGGAGSAAPAGMCVVCATGGELAGAIR